MNKNYTLSAIIGKSSVFLVLCLSLCGCSGDSQKKQAFPGSPRTVLATTTVLATISEQPKAEKKAGASVHGASGTIVFSELGRGVASVLEQEGLSRVVHKGQVGRPYKEVQWLVLSPDGNRIAYVASIDEKYRMVVDGREGKLYEEIEMARFSSDGRHILYSAREHERWHMIVDEKAVGSSPARYKYAGSFFDKKSEKITTVENPFEGPGPHRVVTRDLAFNRLSMNEIDGASRYVVFNQAKSRLALVNEKNGQRRVLDLSFDQPGTVREGPVFDDFVHLTFGDDGDSLAYIAAKGTAQGEERFLVLNNRIERLPEGIIRERPAIRADKKAVGVLIDDEKGMYFHQAYEAAKFKKKKYPQAASLIYNKVGGQYAYIAQQGKRIFMVVNRKEGPAFDMIVTPQFSFDGRFLVYRARKDGKRFVVVADADGNAHRQHPAHEQVYQPVFTDDGASIGYGVKDGTQLIWMVEKL